MKTDFEQDLDWEYPASREGGVPEDKKNYALFIKVRKSFRTIRT